MQRYGACERQKGREPKSRESTDNRNYLLEPPGAIRTFAPDNCIPRAFVRIYTVRYQTSRYIASHNIRDILNTYPAASRLYNRYFARQKLEKKKKRIHIIILERIERHYRNLINKTLRIIME